MAESQKVRQNPVPERRIQAQIMKYLGTLPGTFAWKNQAGPYARKGLPDISLVLDGRYYGFEVKAAIGKPTALQLAAIKSIRAAGAVAEVVRSVEDVKKIIESW